MANKVETNGMAELKLTLGSGGWLRVIKPTLERKLLEAYEKMGDVTGKPPEGMTRHDHVNFLSGRADGLKYVLSTFIQAVAEHESQRYLEQQAQSEPPAAGSPYVATNSPQEGN